MPPSSSPEILALADAIGWEVCGGKDRAARSGDGQFFTPAPIAQQLATWFCEDGLNRPAVRLLDPGAGAGVLTAAAIDRIAALKAAKRLNRLREVSLTAWELDASFVPTLRRNLDASAAALESVGIRTLVELREESYIAGAVDELDNGLFGASETRHFTHAILNPPYKKIASTSRDRARLSSIGIECSNLYAAFVWLALRQLEEGGELSAITPRSFCNGPYFREFRRELLRNSTLDRIHLFDSRKEAFGRDEVLQENLLFHLVRAASPERPVVLSSGSLKEPTSVRIPQSRLVSRNDRDQIIHLATETDSHEVRDFFDSLPSTLSDLGLEVSTGPVVDFRLKSALSRQLGPNCVPLIYPFGIKGGRVLRPLPRSHDYEDARAAKKAVAIESNDESRRWLLPRERYVLIKRFSSKEEKRRLVAGVLEPADFPEGPIGIENHINFFHQRRAGLDAPLAAGLCRFLNSTVADRFFRQFNGHTQVNASDLRAFLYPSAERLRRLGEARLNDAEQCEIDRAVARHLCAPSFNAA